MLNLKEKKKLNLLYLVRSRYEKCWS
jgi:hypothetical protein